MKSADLEIPYLFPQLCSFNLENKKWENLLLQSVRNKIKKDLMD